MAHLKTSAAARMNRDSRPKNLGVKLFSGQGAKVGSIIVRQRGTKFHPGVGVKRGADDTLFSLRTGVVHFGQHHGKPVVFIAAS